MRPSRTGAQQIKVDQICKQSSVICLLSSDTINIRRINANREIYETDVVLGVLHAVLWMGRLPNSDAS